MIVTGPRTDGVRRQAATLAVAVVLGVLVASVLRMLPEGRGAAVASADVPSERVVAWVGERPDYPGPLAETLAASAAMPGDAATAQRAARLMLDEGLSRGDGRRVAAALTLLMPFLDRPTAAVLQIAAEVRLHQHDLTGALAFLDQAVALAPQDALSQSSRAKLLVLRGDPRRARADCDALAAAGLDDLALLCSARTHVLGSDAPVWRNRLEHALAGADSLDPSLKAEAMVILAEIDLNLGDAAMARHRLEGALAAEPGATSAALRLADLQLAAGEGAEALRQIETLPATNTHLVRKAMALRQSGSPEWLSLSRMLDQRFARNIEFGLRGQARDEAMFYLLVAPDAPLALRRALVNWADRREAVDLVLLFASAAAAGDPAAAEDAAAPWVAEHGIVMPRWTLPTVPP